MSGGGSILRVLGGRLNGASVTLPDRGRVLVGHEYWHDVVLRDPSARGIAVEIARDDDGVAHLTALEGEATILGAPLAPGAAAMLPPYVPARLGEVAIAWGEADSPRWTEAERLAASTTAGPPPVSEQEAALAVLSSRWRTGPARIWGRLRRPMLALGVITASGFIVVPPAVDAIQYGIGSEYRARRVLETAGFRNLQVTERAGRLTVSGVVPTDGERLRLQRAFEIAGVDADLAVLTASALARAVADVARLNGVRAEARPQRDGGVVLATAPIDDRTRERLTQVVRRDVPGLTMLRFSEDLGEPRTVSEATKRVASVVTGDPPYILTEDGARYFAGAVLPSGYRLVAIDGNKVRLDRRGKTFTLKF